MISGKDVAACLNIRWENLTNPTSHVLYEELAKQIDGRYLDPLQRENDALKALIQEYQTFITPLRLMSHDARFPKIRELFERSSQLLGEEEQKVSV